MKLLLADEYDSFAAALATPPPVSVRVNDKVALTPSDDPVPWCDNAFYLPERPLFTADPLFHAGAYYVQEASSMFLWQLLERYVARDAVVLDLSAAPGGKSTLISSYLSREGFLVSNEIIRSRAHILVENIIKWGNPNCLVSNNAPRDFSRLPSFFDVLVVDAPCSGEGMFRKDAGAIGEWSEQNVQICTARQQDILADAWDTLKTGGILLYSTCTFNRKENEENVRWIADELGAEILAPDIPGFPEIQRSENGYRFFPDRVRGEGFFIAALRKTVAAPAPAKPKKRDKKQMHQSTAQFSDLKKSLLNPDSMELVVLDDAVYAMQKTDAERVARLRLALTVMHFGVRLADIKGKDKIPHTSLALSKLLNREQVSAAEVDRVSAIRYLRREALHLPDAPKGYVLISYQNLPLGWVKNLGSRSNNLYPQEWRIRMSI